MVGNTKTLVLVFYKLFKNRFTNQSVVSDLTVLLEPNPQLAICINKLILFWKKNHRWNYYFKNQINIVTVVDPSECRPKSTHPFRMGLFIWGYLFNAPILFNLDFKCFCHTFSTLLIHLKLFGFTFRFVGSLLVLYSAFHISYIKY